MSETFPHLGHLHPLITMLLLPGRPSAYCNSTPAPKLELKTTCSLQTSLILPPLAEPLLLFITSMLVLCESKSVSLSCVRLFVSPCTIQPMEFSRPEYWSGKPFPSPGDLPNPWIKPRSSTLQVDSLSTELSGKPMSNTMLMSNTRAV